MTEEKKQEKVVLVVEDNLLVSTAVQDILNDEGFRAVAAGNGREAENLIKDNSPDLILLDMMLPDVSGKDLLKKWKDEYPEIPVIFMTAHGDIPTAVECLKTGAYDFLTKPVEKPLLLKTIKNALEYSNMTHEVKVLKQLTKRKTSDYGELTGVIAGSEPMLKIFDMLKLVAQSDFSCLLLKGESGTGKGLLARTIHDMGTRADKPFVEVNCSALPANLIESELFGHVKGAFTDAKDNKIGLFEMADSGTLFLDEIGDMDFNLQAKLLKVMEEQKFRRIGGTKDISVNVAILAATNQNIEKLVEENKFRLDLYYRLNVIPVEIPPLRERLDDISSLADHFIKFFARKFGKNIKSFSDEAFGALKKYSWPGNVREFRNVVERACILTKGDVIDNLEILFPGTSFKPSVADDASPAVGGISAMPLAEAEKLVMRAAMEEAGGNKNKAASILGVHRTTLYKKLEEYSINAE
jgi:DNA-binding NtrC family response regulator